MCDCGTLPSRQQCDWFTMEGCAGQVGMMRKCAAGQLHLDSAECVSLQQILQAFNSNISEEHAWALFHQGARCFQRCLAEGSTCYLISEPRHVFLHKDGSVHPSTLLECGGKSLLYFWQLIRSCDILSEIQVRNVAFRYAKLKATRFCVNDLVLMMDKV